MNEVIRKYIVVPVILLGLGIAFLILCFLLFISKGNDLILRKKLRIGGLILALQAVAIQGVWPGARCYEGPAPKFVASESALESGTIELNIRETSEVEATLRDATGFDLFFAVVVNESVIQSGAVKASDGRLDSREEKVTIDIDPEKVSAGTYELRLFWGKYNNKIKILKAQPFKTYTLNVRSE
jgi:hypothetical protein